MSHEVVLIQEPTTPGAAEAETVIPPPLEAPPPKAGTAL